MTLRRVAAIVLWGLVLAFLVGLSEGESRRVSIDLWLLLAVVWVGWVIVGDAVAAAPVRADLFQRVWLRGWRPAAGDGRPRGLSQLEGVMANALQSERGADRRLRPRAVALAKHRLQTERGIDISSEPARAAEVLGDVWWLADPTASYERVPTESELARFLDRLSVPEDLSVSNDAVKGG